MPQWAYLGGISGVGLDGFLGEAPTGRPPLIYAPLPPPRLPSEQVAFNSMPSRDDALVQTPPHTQAIALHPASPRTPQVGQVGGLSRPPGLPHGRWPFMASPFSVLTPYGPHQQVRQERVWTPQAPMRGPPVASSRGPSPERSEAPGPEVSSTPPREGRRTRKDMKGRQQPYPPGKGNSQHAQRPPGASN